MTDDTNARVEEIKTKGFTIIPDFLSGERFDRIKTAMGELADAASTGSNEFAGFETIRVFNLVAKTRALDDLIIDPRLLGIIEGVLGKQFQLSITSIIKILPGETAQPLHRDDGLWPVALPHPPLVVNTMFAMDQFTPEVGSTTIVPESHNWPDPVNPDQERESVTMSPGSVLIWDGSCWHGGGTNTTEDGVRTGLNINYNLAWLRQQENQYLAVPRSMVLELPERLQHLLGYRTTHGIVGLVDAQDPLKVLTDGVSDGS